MRIKKYLQKPENKEHIKKAIAKTMAKKYYQRPEVKEGVKKNTCQSV